MHVYPLVLHKTVDIYGFYAEYIRFYHRTQPDASAYTYGSFTLHIRIFRLTRIYVSPYTYGRVC